MRDARCAGSDWDARAAMLILQRTRVLTLPTIVATGLLAYSSIAAAQATAPQKPIAAPPSTGGATIGIQGIAVVGVNWPAASKTLEATGLPTKPVELGGAVQVTNIWRNLFAQVGASRTSDTGERAFVDDQGNVFPLGIALSVKTTYVDVSAGWKLASAEQRNVLTYVGGGVGRVKYVETSPFAQPGDDLETFDNVVPRTGGRGSQSAEVVERVGRHAVSLGTRICSVTAAPRPPSAKRTSVAFTLASDCASASADRPCDKPRRPRTSRRHPPNRPNPLASRIGPRPRSRQRSSVRHPCTCDPMRRSSPCVCSNLEPRSASFKRTTTGSEFSSRIDSSDPASGTCSANTFSFPSKAARSGMSVLASLKAPVRMRQQPSKHTRRTRCTRDKGPFSATILVVLDPPQHILLLLQLPHVVLPLSLPIEHRLPHLPQSTDGAS